MFTPSLKEKNNDNPTAYNFLFPEFVLANQKTFIGFCLKQ